MPELQEDPILQPVADFLSLYQEEFSTITFPDISKEILDDLAEKVKQKASDLDEANAMAAAAKEALENSQNELLQKCLRGLAYAKVYAEDRDELLEKLSKVTLGKTSKPSKKSLPDKKNQDKSDDLSEDEKSDKRASKSKKTEPVAATEDLVN
jgi:hypothetical protein